MARTRRGGGGGVKVTPSIPLVDAETTRALNLTVLRRADPAVTDILITVAHVAAYTFDASYTLQWRRKGVDGPLFVVERSEHPTLQLVVMNRQSTENLVQDLLTDFQYEVNVPYVMYRNAADEFIGIWFYDPQECHEVERLFTRIQHAFSMASPKSNRTSKSDFEELEVASAVPGVEDTLEQSTLSVTVADDTKNESLAPFSTAAASVGDTSGGTAGADLNLSFRSVPSPSHQPHSASASQTSVLHNLFRSQTSACMRPFDAIISHNSATIQSSCPVNPTTLFPPITCTRTAKADAASSSVSVLPPLHPPIASHQPQSVPLHHHPFALPMPSPSPPYDMPLLQPFPQPKPSPLLTPSASYVTVLTRDQVKGALLRLVQNDSFIDMVYREIVKRPYPWP